VARSATQIIPAKAGIQRIRARSATQIIPAKAGIQRIRARSATQIIPAHFGNRAGIHFSTVNSQWIPAELGSCGRTFP
jgi:hypothetical protein